MIADWSGRRVQQARFYMQQRLPAICAAERHARHCPGVIDGTDPAAWVVGHTLSRAEHPEQTWNVRNWRIEARVCSDTTGHSVAIAKARAAGARDALAEKNRDEKNRDEKKVDVEDGALFPAAPTSQEGKPSTLSLSRDQSRPRITNASKAQPAAISRDPLDVRPELRWDADRVRAFPWLAEFADVPDDASPPLAMTYPSDEAVGSYGRAIIVWAEAEHGVTLRWWQRFAIVRQHEHRADGSLIWAEVDESAPRRSGKSVRLRAVATWRLSHAAFIGEVQTIIHCGNDLPICREIQRGAWRWAENKWGKKAVTMANGKEAIENTEDGSRWLVRSQGGVYGFDAGLGAVDEAWDVKTDTVTEGLEPALLERLWAQLHITSTAHRRATSLMKTKIAACLAADDGRTLLMLWGALPQDDPGDPATWRKASAHWTEARRQLIASKYEKALAGEADPQADDPDPMEGFRAQYLNIWPLSTGAPERGSPIVDRAAWAELVLAKPSSAPTSAAIESHFDAGISLALAWRLTDGGAVVSVQIHDDLALAGIALAASGFTGQPIVGASLVDDPALRPLRPTKGAGRGLGAVLDVARWLAEGQIAHDESPDLTGQVLAVRTVAGADGQRLASHGRLDAVKAAAWAVSAARSQPARRVGDRVLTASAP